MELRDHPMDMKSGEFKTLHIASSWFKNGTVIPRRFTCEGEDINPPLDIEGIPQQARSLVLIVDDPDAPRGTWLHWSVWNIPVKHHIEENSVPGQEGQNDFGRTSYGGPCPPSGTHRYYFKVFALDDVLGLPPGAKVEQLYKAMEGHIVAFGELMGTYKKTIHEKHSVSR